jgi:GT2 family glycosyltransferase
MLPMAEPPTLSVIVMGYDDAATIVRAVRSVVDQADHHTDVVVVTSGRDDSAGRVQRAFPLLTVVSSPERLLPGGARNVGVAVSGGDLVAFLAADCVAEPGWVAGRRRAHDHGHAVVASAVTNGARRNLPAWGFHFDVYSARLAGHPARVVAGTDHAAHGCSFTRATLERLGPFDDTVLIGEDTDAARRLDGLGIPVWFEPSVRTAHVGPTSTRALWRDRVRRGTARANRAGVADGSARGSFRRTLRVWFGDARAAWRGAGSDRGWFWASLPWIALSKVAAGTGQCAARRRAVE